MTIVLTGASGSIGRRLLETLLAAGHTLRVLTRRPGLKLPPGVALSLWEPERGAPPPDALRDAEAVVHLAGEPVAQRWTPEANAASSRAAWRARAAWWKAWPNFASGRPR